MWVSGRNVGLDTRILGVWCFWWVDVSLCSTHFELPSHVVVTTPKLSCCDNGQISGMSATQVNRHHV